MKKWHTRFAPSPTGSLHLGSLRTALFNWLAARASGGTFTLRIEDTDRERNVEGAADEIVNVLRWTGLFPDKGTINGAVDAEYVQSQRLELYQRVIREMLRSGLAYRCFCSKERLEAIRGSAVYKSYDRRCRDIPYSPQVEPSSIRLRIPKDHYIVEYRDILHGRITRLYSELEDVVLVRSNGIPTYHFANVVDDHSMGVNLVMRGQVNAHIYD